MIPCFICEKDASTGWIKGYPPAPDSQKIALCAEHDSEENRLKAAEAWYALVSGHLAAMNEVARNKVMPHLLLGTIRFIAGGMLSFTCIACEPTAHGTLRIDAPDGSSIYIPMAHIREYRLHPYIEDEAGALAKTPTLPPKPFQEQPGLPQAGKKTP